METVRPWSGPEDEPDETDLRLLSGPEDDDDEGTDESAPEDSVSDLFDSALD